MAYLNPVSRSRYLLLLLSQYLETFFGGYDIAATIAYCVQGFFTVLNLERVKSGVRSVWSE